MTNAELTKEVIELVDIIESLQRAVINLQKDVMHHLQMHIDGAGVDE